MKKLISSVALSIIALTTYAQGDSEIHAIEKLNALIFHVQRSYVEEVDTEKLVEDAIIGMLSKLDPHSVYIPADELKEMNEPLEGNFEGIGVQFNIIHDTIVVVSPISGGPSEKLGIQSGDRIVDIEGEIAAGVGIKNSDVMKKLKGAKGTTVNIKVLRNGYKDLIPYAIVRDKIPIYSIDAVYMATPEIGYIKVNRFAATTMDEFTAALDTLKKQGMKDLILDLQGNGGGLLKTAIDLADEFIDQNKLLVYTEGRAYPKSETFARKIGGFETGRLVIMIDEGSASASEIVSGAVQDWDRGIVVGRRSFGKGLVQRPVPLPDGSAVRLTIQKYYTPSGRCIQKPYTEDLEAYQREKFERFEKGELTSQDSINMPDSLKFFTSKQRLVYGGGGIMPDLFVPIDTSNYSQLNNNLIRKGVFNSFTLSYSENQKALLKEKYTTVAEFEKGFECSQPLMDEFFAHASKEGVEYDEEQYMKSKTMIDNRLKAMIARNIWDTSAYYQVFNPQWPTYQKALSVLKDNKLYMMQLVNN